MDLLQSVLCGLDQPQAERDFKRSMACRSGEGNAAPNNLKRAALLALLGFTAVSALGADICEPWDLDDEKPKVVTVLTCSRENGKSGYYRVINNGTRPAKVCFEIKPADSSRSVLPRCTHILKPSENYGTPTCWECGSANGGIVGVVLKKYEPQ